MEILLPLKFFLLFINCSINILQKLYNIYILHRYYLFKFNPYRDQEQQTNHNYMILKQQ